MACELPPDLSCQRTGRPANTPEACGACDACLWVAAMEAEFVEREVEREEDDPDRLDIA